MPKKPISERERLIGFIYVLLLFLLVIGTCGTLLLKHAGGSRLFAQKIMVVKKMERQKDFRAFQAAQAATVDSLFYRIKEFNPGVNASYEENDIKFLLNDLTGRWEQRGWDKRNKVFWHLSSLYGMWFADKKELWSKQENIILFKKNLEECELGLRKKENELNAKKGK